MRKYIWLVLMLLFVPSYVHASELDAIEQINDYKLERDSALIEKTNDLASTIISIPKEEIKSETKLLNIENLGLILYIIPVAGSLIMYTLIIKAKEVQEF